MKRLAISALGASLVVMSLGVSGCGGGGLEEGVPRDTTLQPPPANVQTKMGPPSKSTHGKVGGRPSGWKGQSHA